MLVLSRKVGERVRIGDAEVTIIRIGGSGVRLGIEAPEDVPIVRTELPPLDGAAGASGDSPATPPVKSA